MGPPFPVCEMMFGLGDQFQYHECVDCLSLQITEIPSSMERYYSSDYYSFDSSSRHMSALESLHALCYRIELRTGVRVQAASRTLVQKLFLATDFGNQFECLDLTKDSKILDVGCGNGQFLRMLRLHGFENLVGIDPYLRNNVDEPGLRLLRTDIHGVNESFDVAMFMHSLEHTPNPLEALERTRAILNEGGKCLVRIPVVPSYVWDKYRSHWVQLDAPRHLFIPSVLGMKRLALRVGLEVFRVVYDSTEFQFWGSEQYANKVPLKSPISYSVDKSKSMFTPGQIREYRRLSMELNRTQQGDQAVFYMRRP